MLELLYEQIFFVHAALSLRQDSCCMRQYTGQRDYVELFTVLLGLRARNAN